MNFYLSAGNDLLRHPDDQPSIGLVLCKTNDRIVAEYALRDINKADRHLRIPARRESSGPVEGQLANDRRTGE